MRIRLRLGGNLAGELQLHGGRAGHRTMGGVLLTSETLLRSKINQVDDATKVGRYTHAGEEWQSPYRKQRFDTPLMLENSRDQRGTDIVPESQSL